MNFGIDFVVVLKKFRSQLVFLSFSIICLAILWLIRDLVNSGFFATLNQSAVYFSEIGPKFFLEIFPWDSISLFLVSLLFLELLVNLKKNGKEKEKS